MGVPHTAHLRAAHRESPITELVGNAATISVRVDPNCSHNFAGIEYFSDAEGETPVQPAGGMATFSLRTFVQPFGFQPFDNNTVPANALGQVDWASNTTEVQAELTGITGSATHARVLYIGNIS